MITPPSRTATLVRFVAYSLLLFASWNHNLLGIPDGVHWSRTEARSGYLGSESHLVVCRLVHAGEVHPCYPLAGPAADVGFVPYPSQVGLTGIGLAAIQNATGLPTSSVAKAAGIAFVLLTALTLAAVFASAQRWLGPPAGDVACVLAASTTAFLPFAPSLYWVPWLLLAPFAITWCFYSMALTPGRRVALFASVGLAVLAKSLCGYEYITAVIAAPVAAAWFHHHRLGEPLSPRVRTAFALVGVGLLGFAAAMILHVVQQDVVLGQDGVEVIRNRALTRTASNPQAEVALSGVAGEIPPSRSAFAIRCFLEYFDQRAISIAGGFGRIQKDVPLNVVVLLAIAFALTAGLARRRWPREATALAGALMLGLLASVSWQVLAINHMCVHRHLNLIVFSVPFLPLAYLASGTTVRLVFGEWFARWVGPMLLVSLAGVMLVNVHCDTQRRIGEAAEQEAAEGAVGNRLGEAIPPPDGALGGAVDLVWSASKVPDSLLMEYGLMDLATGRAHDPDALVIDGWSLGECKTTARPTTRVVVACGDTIVPAEVLRFRRPDIEKPIGKALPGSGFIAVIRSADLTPGGRLRVFVVSTADPNRIAELAVKP